MEGEVKHGATKHGRHKEQRTGSLF